MNRAPAVRLVPWSILGAALVLPIAVVLHGAVRRPGGATLEEYGVVPEFSLVERSGRPVRMADLRGTPWVASFLFTRCSGSCPTLSRELGRLERRLGSRARLVSFTVDPTHDTPEILRRYAEQVGAPSSRWLFLTGDRAALHDVVQQGFRLSIAEEPSADPGEAVTHSSRVALVDRDGRIRGYYLTTEEGWADRVLGDLDALESARG
ncbi:MAG: hypothetical protein QOD06_2624 [Candidatus Binatota bacterium]|nr:hypothetical protein [Candidatus Binatota bacterium]